MGDWKSLPIYDLNEGIRTKCMERFAERKEGSKEWVTVLCPNMEKKLINNLAVGLYWRVMRSDTYVYEVQCQKYRVMVNLGEDFVWSCGEWKCHGFPCSHALVAIQQHGVSPYLYVSPYYKVLFYSFRFFTPYLFLFPVFVSCILVSCFCFLLLLTNMSSNCLFFNVTDYVTTNVTDHVTACFSRWINSEKPTLTPLTQSLPFQCMLILLDHHFHCSLL